MNINNNEIKEELNKKGIKNTRAKSLLLQILKESKFPKNVSSLHEECFKVVNVNLATIYRTLKQFHEKKIVQEFLDNDGLARYEYINQGISSHPHFQCEKCNKLFCLEELHFDDALYFSNMAKQHKVSSINITINGICKGCC